MRRILEAETKPLRGGAVTDRESSQLPFGALAKIYHPGRLQVDPVGGPAGVYPVTP